MIVHNFKAFRGYASYAGVKLLPPALVPIARSLLQSQGIDARAVSDSGEIDPQALVALAFDKVEIRTAYTKPIMVDLKGPPDPETARLLADIRPQIKLSGRAGEAEIAPYGQKAAGESSGFPSLNTPTGRIALGIGAGAIGLLFVGALLFSGRK